MFFGSLTGCEHNGIKYMPGEPYQDDCNQCFCGSNGFSGCTLMMCPPKGKQYSNIHYYRINCLVLLIYVTKYTVLNRRKHCNGDAIVVK